MLPARKSLMNVRAGIVILAVIAICAAGYWYWSKPDKRARDALLRLAIRTADRGEDAKAIDLLDQFLKIEPLHPKALLYRGQLARNQGDIGAAAAFWSKVTDEPAREGGTARFLEGTLWLESNRTRDAEAAFRKAIQLNPSYLQPHERLLKLYVAQLRTADIQRELEAIRRFRPWSLAELYQLVNLTSQPTNSVQSIPRVEQFLAADPRDQHSLIALGRFYLWEDQYREAADVFRKVLVHQPDDVSLRALLVEAQVGQLDLDGAREILTGMLPDVTSPQWVWRSHGLYWLARQDWKKAVTCFERAVILDANDLTAVYKLAQALERTENGAAAKPYLKRVELLEKLQAAMWILAQWDQAKAEKPLASVIEAGSFLLQLERYSDAVPFFELALTWDPTSKPARKNLVLAMERTAASQHKRSSLPELNLSTLDMDSWFLPESSVVKNTQATIPGKSVVTHPDIQFVDHHADARLDFRYFNGDSGQKYLLETTGGGVGVLDYDSDGWPDVFFPQGCRLPYQSTDLTHLDQFCRNQQDGTFSNITTSARLGDNQFSQGCGIADFNNDGFPDIALANYGTNVLYRNNGDGTFTDVTPESRINGSHWSTSLGWGDVDRDGNLDLYVVNYVQDALRVCHKPTGAPATCHPQVFTAEDDILYLSRGDGSFQDVTRDVGMTAPNGKGLGLVIADLDGDGWQDVYVANDGTPNFLFHNKGDDEGHGLKFDQIGLASGTALNAEGVAQAGMGVACVDLDGDGRLDLFVTNFYRETNTLYLNRGQMLFEDSTVQTGLAEPSKYMLGFGTQALDVDLDGHSELFVANGHVDDHRDEGLPWKMPPQLFYNQGNARFSDISQTSGEFFSVKTLGRGVARLDWNRDGLPDIIVVHQDCPAALLRNETRAFGHHLTLALHGVKSNRNAIGARIRAVSEGNEQIFEVCGGDGYAVSNEQRHVIGLGSSIGVDILEIRWPHGSTDRFTGLSANCEVTVIEGQQPWISKKQGGTD